MERKLASVRRITEIRPIEGADAFECAIVGGGWPVVIRKNEFKAGDLAVFCEIDSFIPYELAPFLSKGKEPREFNGVKGERLRTAKIRGQISQGLLLPISVLAGYADTFIDGDDVTGALGIQKWEKPIPACLAGQMRGSFPSFLRKTDQERVQNLDGKIDWDAGYEISIKLDGSSMTIWFKDGDWGVCSRNIDLKLDQEGNTLVDVAKRVVGNIDWPDNIAIHGELMGPNIKGNREALTEHEFFVFDIWDIHRQAYMIPSDVRKFCRMYGLNHVPVLHVGCTLREFGISSINDALYQAEGPSMNTINVREGLVFKCINGAFSFEAISNTFLLGEK